MLPDHSVNLTLAYLGLGSTTERGLWCTQGSENYRDSYRLWKMNLREKLKEAVIIQQEEWIKGRINNFLQI
jgi:hypothetical protein